MLDIAFLYMASRIPPQPVLTSLLVNYSSCLK
uniref:Uncharacterized protein n=1 Tax=Arundo donax TaxID=35708 RepID=A0A0A9Q767_ARUDO